MVPQLPEQLRVAEPRVDRLPVERRFPAELGGHAALQPGPFERVAAIKIYFELHPVLHIRVIRVILYMGLGVIRVKISGLLGHWSIGGIRLSLLLGYWGYSSIIGIHPFKTLPTLGLLNIVGIQPLGLYMHCDHSKYWGIKVFNYTSIVGIHPFKTLQIFGLLRYCRYLTIVVYMHCGHSNIRGIRTLCHTKRPGYQVL